MPEGFDYSVTAKGLIPGAVYDVKAYPLEESSDYGTVTSYTLGTLTADSEGELSGFYDLAGGGYDWEITVENAGEVILQTHPQDAAGFGVSA